MSVTLSTNESSVLQTKISKNKSGIVKTQLVLYRFKRQSKQQLFHISMDAKRERENKTTQTEHYFAHSLSDGFKG